MVDQSVTWLTSVADRTDFRPDYKKLGSLKTLFPNVPIQAVVSCNTSSCDSYIANRNVDRNSQHQDIARSAQDS